MLFFSTFQIFNGGMILIKIAFFFKVPLDWWIELMHLNFLKLVAIWKILFGDVRTEVYNDAKLYKHDGLVIYVTCVLAGNNSYCTGPWVYKLREDDMSISLFLKHINNMPMYLCKHCPTFAWLFFWEIINDWHPITVE